MKFSFLILFHSPNIYEALLSTVYCYVAKKNNLLFLKAMSPSLSPVAEGTVSGGLEDTHLKTEAYKYSVVRLVSVFEKIVRRLFCKIRIEHMDCSCGFQSLESRVGLKSMATLSSDKRLYIFFRYLWGLKIWIYFNSSRVFIALRSCVAVIHLFYSLMRSEVVSIYTHSWRLVWVCNWWTDQIIVVDKKKYWYGNIALFPPARKLSIHWRQISIFPY